MDRNCEIKIEVNSYINFCDNNNYLESYGYTRTQRRDRLHRNMSTPKIFNRQS